MKSDVQMTLVSKRGKRETESPLLKCLRMPIKWAEIDADAGAIFLVKQIE